MITFITILHLWYFAAWSRHIYNIMYKDYELDIFDRDPNFATVTIAVGSVFGIMYWSYLIIRYLP